MTEIAGATVLRGGRPGCRVPARQPRERVNFVIFFTSRTDALGDRVGDLEVQFARFDERLGSVEKGNDQLQQSINTLIQLHLNAAAEDR